MDGLSLGTLADDGSILYGFERIVLYSWDLSAVLFYIPAYVVVLWYGTTIPRVGGITRKRYLWIGMMLTGLILEAYVNPVFVKMIFFIKRRKAAECRRKAG